MSITDDEKEDLALDVLKDIKDKLCDKTENDQFDLFDMLDVLARVCAASFDFATEVKYPEAMSIFLHHMATYHMLNVGDREKNNES